MATLKDIAKIANVNVSTVSKALRNSNDLKPDTILRIREVANQLNYPYNPGPKAKTKVKAAGVVCPEIISSFYTNIAQSFQSHMNNAGFSTIFMVSNFSPQQEIECIEMLVDCNVSGIVLFTENSVNSSKLKLISELRGTTFLLVSTVEDIDFCDSICIDDRQGAMMAVNHLADIGHHDIAYIGDSLSFVRKASFIQALQNRGIEVKNEWIVESDLRFEECGYEGMLKLLRLGKRPTGIFAAYDNIAIGAMRAIYENGYSVPEDFSIVGIDNINTSAYLYKSLTTVNEPTEDLGKMASSLILDKINDRLKIIQNIKLKPTLNIRETTAPLRK